MAVENKNLEIGMKAPGFKLPDIITGTEITLDLVRGKRATVIMFICNHCPYVKHVVEEIVKIANDYKGSEISFLAINSNDADKYPEDAPDKMKEFAAMHSFSFPYLYDESQHVAKEYDAACTPEFYVFNNELKLHYHGQLDDSRPKNNIPVTGSDLRNALNQVLDGKAPVEPQKPSIGCSIKWK